MFIRFLIVTCVRWNECIWIYMYLCIYYIYMYVCIYYIKGSYVSEKWIIICNFIVKFSFPPLWGLLIWPLSLHVHAWTCTNIRCFFLNAWTCTVINSFSNNFTAECFLLFLQSFQSSYSFCLLNCLILAVA